MTIPASAIVNVVPGVLSAGGTALQLSGVFLTQSTRVPIGTILTLTTAASVASYFGSGSAEALRATVYFNGPDNSTIKPAAMLFAQYPTAAVPAYLRGGAFGLTLTQLKALPTGTIAIPVQGVTRTSATIDLSGATSFSNAATIITTALNANDFVGVITTVSGNPQISVTTATSGALAIGQVVVAAGVPVGSTIGSFGSGTGGTGTYNLVLGGAPSNATASASGIAMTAGAIIASYDSTSGAFVITDGTPGITSTIAASTTSTLATSLALTATAGAVTSQGAAIAVPNTFMDSIVALTQNFVSFTTLGFEPVTSDCLLFAQWTNGKKNRYLYVCWDSDINATLPGQTTTIAAQVIAAGYSGTAFIYEPTPLYQSAFLMGAIASLDFNRFNGRYTMAFQSQSGIVPGVTDGTIAAQLLANGYNFYGSYATAAQGFQFLYNGSVTGPFLWLDSYACEVWMNNGFQLALMTLLTTIGHIPYNAQGYGLIEQSMSDQINAALAFGAIVSGVTLTGTQIAAVNSAAGRKIDDVIFQRGWYLLIQDPGASVRAARGSPIITFFYTDGQSVQSINLNSVEIV